MRRFLLCLTATVCALLPVLGHAAEITSVMSAFDEGDAFDGALSVGYDWRFRTSRIDRQALCSNVAGLCPGQQRVLSLRELTSERTTHQLNVQVRAGFFQDMEFFVNLPVVLHDRTRLDFASGVDWANSSIDPLGGPSLFSVPNEGRVRSGFGDMSLGIRYAPLSQSRDPLYPSLLIAFTYTIPTGSLRQAGNAKVGSGLHVLRIETAASRRIAFVEPYFGLFGHLRFPAADTLYRDYGDPQGQVWPGQQIGMTVGTEFFPWARPAPDGSKGRYVSMDVGFSAMYTFAGRGDTDLFDALGTSSCNGDPNCLLTRYTRTVDNDPTPAILRMDGITDVGAFATISTWAGLNVQPIPNVALGVRFTYSRETAHYLTNADVGRDLDGNDPGGSPGVDFSNSRGQNEYNPVFNEHVDEPGKRLRSTGSNIYAIMVTLTGRL